MTPIKIHTKRTCKDHAEGCLKIRSPKQIPYSGQNILHRPWGPSTKNGVVKYKPGTSQHPCLVTRITCGKNDSEKGMGKNGVDYNEYQLIFASFCREDYPE